MTVAEVTKTTNGMKALKSTMNKNVDLFFKIGASRGKFNVKQWVEAAKEDTDIAVRIALWARDIREGSGERQIFRDILRYLAHNELNIAKALLPKIPELGRWDDLLVLVNTPVQHEAFELIAKGLAEGNGLCAKWMPRKGEVAAKLRKHLSLTPKSYRKLLVGLSNTVEQQMCAKQWKKINYEHVPSVAAARYQKAFKRNDEVRYGKYVESLQKGEAKINAGAIYPYTIVQTLAKGVASVAVEQWKALPDFVPEGLNFLPVVDVSGSMYCPAGGNPSITCADVAISLGLYLSERNKSKFKDAFITFSERPKLQYLKGNLQERYRQLERADWGMSTNLEATFDLILDTAVKNNLKQSSMPTHIVILSDMQFNACVRNTSAIRMIREKFSQAGYEIPAVVFWNLKAANNVPVAFDENGTALISGFSPSVMKNILAGKNLNPQSIMLDTVMVERYNWK